MSDAPRAPSRTSGLFPPPAEGRPILPRLTTGNLQLDDILGGGLPANSINILMGEPGCGKTILAEQMVFANAQVDDRAILYFTTLSEPLDKVVRYLQQFSFFDASKMMASVFYSSIGEELTQKGIAMLVPCLKEAILRQRPKIIVIDSFKAIHDLSTSVAEMRKILYEIAGLLTAYETTAFFLGEYGDHDLGKYPEFAVADGMIQLARNNLGTRDERFLRVLKLRGSGYLEGLHAFRIDGDGLEVYPRLVSPRIAPSYQAADELVPTGVAGLDQILGGGLLRGRSTFLLGPTGSGKTTMALQFVLEGLRRGERCLYVSFEENPAQLAPHIRALGTDPDAAARAGLSILYVSPVELQIDSIIDTVFNAIREHGVRRVVIDAVGDLLGAASDLQRLHSYLYALAQHFAVQGVSSIFTYEIAANGEVERRLSALADNILMIGVEVAERRGLRTLRMVKARGIAHDLDVHELRITSKGAEVV
jgi:circadian clock protein KaiC